MDYKAGILESAPANISAANAFIEVFGGQVTFKKICQTCAEFHMALPHPPEDASSYTCWGRNMGGNMIYTFRNAPASGISKVFQWGIHELFHGFDNLTGNAGREFAESYNRNIFDISRGWQQSLQTDSWEVFADMGIAWTYSHWSPTSNEAPIAAVNMSEFMQKSVLNLYYGR